MTKQELRTKYKQLRGSIPADGKKKLDHLIVSHLAQAKIFRQAKTVLLYVPVRGEIDLLPLIRLCRKQGKQVGLPVTDRENRTMEFHVLEPDKKLVPGAYGIPEPPDGSPICEINDRTLCVLPGLSFDRTGYRLGYGAGYYDRFLEGFPGITVGAVYEKMIEDMLPHEPHDKRVSYLVHERGILRCVASALGAVNGKSSPRTTKQQGAKPSEGLSKTADALLKFKAKAGAFLSEWLLPVRKTLNRWLQADPNPKKTGPSEMTSAEGKKLNPRHGPPILVFLTFIFLILSRVIEGRITRQGSEYILVILLQILIFILPAVLYIQLRGEYFPSRIRMRPVRPEHFWFCFCVLVVMVCGSLLISILTGGIASLSGNFTLYNTFVVRINGSVWETVYVILAYCVLPAFCEELVYRSVLCAEYEGAGTGVAIFVSAVFFAMLHFSFPLFLNYLFLGVLLAGVMYATRSTMASMILHLLYNLFCLFGQPYLSAFYVNAGSSEIFIFCLIILLLLFAAFGAGEARKIYHLYARANVDSGYTVSVRLAEYPKRVAKVLCTPTAAVDAVVWLVMAILAAVR